MQNNKEPEDLGCINVTVFDDLFVKVLYAYILFVCF